VVGTSVTFNVSTWSASLLSSVVRPEINAKTKKTRCIWYQIMQKGGKMYKVLLYVTTILAVSFAQSVDTIFLPVTYYDFHDDKSNPEFDQDNKRSALTTIHPEITGLAKAVLDADMKPVVNNIVGGARNAYMKYWFRAWDSPKGGKNDFTIPFYTDTPPTMCYIGYPNWCSLPGNCSCLAYFWANVTYHGTITVPFDTGFKNIAIKDTIPFILINADSGIYQFRDTAFYPIDHRGFGPDYAYNMFGDSLAPTDMHNYCYTMEIQTTFKYRNGMFLRVESDDDSWVFVNGKLIIDLGGFHFASKNAALLDTMAGNLNITPGATYPLSIYYANRSGNATFTFASNMMEPNSVVIKNQFIGNRKSLAMQATKRFDIAGRLLINSRITAHIGLVMVKNANGIIQIID
jgi:fibro-slime domain-containing protein